MTNEIIGNQEQFPDKYSNLKKYDYTEFKLKKHQAINAHYESRKFSNERFKSGRFEQCSFNGCSFESTGLSGTRFIASKLCDCDITSSNLQFCEFAQKSIFQGNSKTSEIHSSNLSQSMFHDSELRNLRIKDTTISQAQFINTILDDVVFDSCTLQDNIFKNVVFKNTSLIGCNLEYSEFNNVILSNVKLPFHQLPYTLGLLSHLENAPEEIMISAVSTTYPIISAKDYINLMPELFSYYSEMEDFFPAINIALFLKQYEKANELIETGIQYYIRTNDFRKIKGICTLIASNPFFDKHYMTQLYLKIVEYYNKISISDYDKYQYSLHINNIKRILTVSENILPTVQLYIKTNITSKDVEKIGILYQLIEQCVCDGGIADEEYVVEVRHNSEPLSFWVMLSDINPQHIIYVVGVLMTVFTENYAYIQTALDVIANASTIGAFILQISQAKNTSPIALPTKDNNAMKEMKQIKEKCHRLKTRKINVEIHLPFFNFSYQNEIQYENQN